MIEVLKALAHSRKFWLAVFGVAQAVIFQLFPNIPDSLWQSIVALVMVLIGSIAWEDAASKSGDVYLVQDEEE